MSCSLRVGPTECLRQSRSVRNSTGCNPMHTQCYLLCSKPFSPDIDVFHYRLQDGTWTCTQGWLGSKQQIFFFTNLALKRENIMAECYDKLSDLAKRLNELAQIPGDYFTSAQEMCAAGLFGRWRLRGAGPWRVDRRHRGVD